MEEEFLLAADIGGTNTNVSVVRRRKNAYKIVRKIRESTRHVKSMSALFSSFLQEAHNDGFEITRGGVAVAGPVRNGKVKMTNAHHVISEQEILKNTSLQSVVLINDFEATGLATNVLIKSHVHVLQKSRRTKDMRVVIGPGTGLGKSMLYYDHIKEQYVQLPSEGGNTDFTIRSAFELELAEFVQSRFCVNQMSYEHVLSGRGIVKIYEFLQQKKYPKLPLHVSPRAISESQHENQCSKETFELFVNYLARFAKNAALDVLSFGGLYLAGGITAKNSEVIRRLFLEEFRSHHTYAEILEQIPVYVIVDYDTSLLGAAYAVCGNYC